VLKSDRSRLILKCIGEAVKKIPDLTAWQARRYRLIPSSETEFEVFSLEKSVTYTVNLDFMACTCFQWQSTGIPCSHAIAVILKRKEDPQTYCQKFFSLDAYRNSYANAIHAPNADENQVRTFTEDHGNLDGNLDSNLDGNLGGKQQIIPPHARCPPGRPQKRRIRNGVEGPFGKKRQKKCSRCGGYGHALTTCDAAI
jgi:zinc finger SWIM domain-containing protein 3